MPQNFCFQCIVDWGMQFVLKQVNVTIFFVSYLIIAENCKVPTFSFASICSLNIFSHKQICLACRAHKILELLVFMESGKSLFSCRGTCFLP